LLSAQSSLLSEIKPEVSNLLSRVETHLDKLDRREQALMAKCELQEGRVTAATERGTSHSRKSSKSKAGATAVPAAKMQMLLQKKERLSFAIDRLQLQAQQRERQLRKSLAVAPVLEDEDLDF
jgi:DASH complex subunit SPC19